MVIQSSPQCTAIGEHGCWNISKRVLWSWELLRTCLLPSLTAKEKGRMTIPSLDGEVVDKICRHFSKVSLWLLQASCCWEEQVSREWFPVLLHCKEFRARTETLWCERDSGFQSISDPELWLFLQLGGLSFDWPIPWRYNLHSWPPQRDQFQTFELGLRDRRANFPERWG